MKVVVIKYNAGNIQSVLFALERIGINAVVTDNIHEITTADKVIFPGVGEASSAMNYLREKELDKVIVSLKQPVLGICLGMQLMCQHSEEGNTNCLGIFNSNVKLFPSPFEGGVRRMGDVKVPQIGWNSIYDLKTDLYKGIKEKEHVYFVHSYYVGLGDYTIAKTNYGIAYSSSLHKNNFYGAQFHPEKSGDAGEIILKNFLEITS